MNQTITLRTLIYELLARNLLLSTAEAKIIKAQSESPKLAPTSPWFIKVLMGFSAWLTTSLLLLFIFTAHLVESSQSAIVLGSLLVIATVVLHRLPLLKLSSQLFLEQLWLALNLTGQILFIGGTGLETEVQTAALVALALTTLLMVIYQDAVHRFISVLIATVAIVILLNELAAPQQAIHLVSFGLAVGATWCWLGEAHHLTNPAMATLYRPLGYGLVVALQLLLLLSITSIPHYLYLTNWWWSTVGMTILLLTVEYQLLEINHVKLWSPHSAIIFLGTLLISLLLYQSPGLIAAIIITLAAFQRSNRVLLGLSIAFFTVFLVAYYYHLELTLLMKSVALMSSGVVLLGLRQLLKRTGSMTPGGK